MANRPRHRALPIRFSFWKLALGVALGIWLGGLAFLLTCGLIYKVYMNQQFPPLPVNASPSTAPVPDASQQMFDQYRRNQEKLQGRTGTDSPQCQFWQEQNEARPTAKTRDNIAHYCAE
ncbi:hypothetical protein [Pseudomonas sp. Marseille-Q8238]